ncbi:MAG: hypothetical protein JXA94_06775 [Parachlamydiales bacterium]|nr:hypothetical protein [Parachlamydiales bacterium]
MVNPIRTDNQTPGCFAFLSGFKRQAQKLTHKIEDFIHDRRVRSQGYDQLQEEITERAVKEDLPPPPYSKGTPPRYSVIDPNPIATTPVRQIVGYWEDWNCWQTRITDISDEYTIYNIAFATTKDDTLNISSYMTEAQLVQMDLDIETMHSNGKKICLSVGGATDQFQINDPQVLAKNIVDFIEKHDLDGVDLDDEHMVDFPDGQTKFILLIQALRKELDTRFPDSHKLISYTALPNGVDDKAPDYPQDQNYNQAVKILETCIDDLDLVQIMCYNKTGISYTRAQDEVEQFLKKTPASKLVLGIMPGKDDLGEDCPLTGSDQSCETLAQYAKDKNLAGLMIWDGNRDLQGQDGNPKNAYVAKVAQVFNNVIKPQPLTPSHKPHPEPIDPQMKPLNPSTGPKPAPLTPSTPPKPYPINTKKNSVYIDLAQFENVFHDAIKAGTEQFPYGYYDESELKLAFDAIFKALNQDGSDEICLSFAQICDIANLLTAKGSYTPSDKVLEVLMYGTPPNLAYNKPIFNAETSTLSDLNILQYMLSYASTKYNIKIDLSLGGAAASALDYAFNEDPKKAALDLVNFMNAYNIQDVDFDLENIEGFMTNGSDKILTFFQTLKSLLAKENKKIYLTLLGDTTKGPNGPLKPIFDNFDTYVDGVRLMLYSNSQFYLDADNKNYGINLWIDAVKGPSKLSIGFFDMIAYENPQLTDPDYDEKQKDGFYSDFPKNPTRGQAAVWIYKKVASQLKLNFENFQKPFIWTNVPQNIPNNEFMKDFNEALSN